MRAARWRLDLSALLDAVTDRTRVLLVNAPNNPTGWTLVARRAAGDPRPLPAHRHLDRGRRGLRTAVLRAPAARDRCAPSFLDIADARRPPASSRTASRKSFLMTGWRLGWLVVPADARRRGRQADRVQHLVRAGVRAARRPGGAWRRPRASCRRWCSACAPAATACSPSWRACRASRWRRRPAACTPSCASTAKPTRSPSPSGWWPKHGLGLAPGHRFRRRGRGLAALVLRVARSRAA